MHQNNNSNTCVCVSTRVRFYVEIYLQAMFDQADVYISAYNGKKECSD